MGSATSQAPRLYDLRVSRAPVDPERISKFASAVADGIAHGLEETGDRRIGSGELTSLMLVSAWMRRAGTDLGESVDSLLALRRALVQAAGFDRSSEPVPLLPADDKVAVVNLVLYLEDLVWRASAARECGFSEIAARALELIEV